MNATQKSGVVQIAGKKYAVNLSWLNTKDPNKIRQEAIETAKSDSYKADYFCLGEKQFALGDKAYGHKEGIPSLALQILSSGTANSFLAVFKTNPGWYLLAVKDGLILPDHDRLFWEEQQAKKFCIDTLEDTNDWSFISIPESWELDKENIKRYQVEDLVLKGKSYKLQDVDHDKKAIKLGVFVIVAMSLFFAGVSIVKEHRDKKELEALIIAEAARKRDVKVVEEPKPWENKFKAKPFLTSCAEQSKTMPMSVPGWQAVHLLCDGNGTIAVEFTREEGTINWLNYYIDEYYPEVKVSYGTSKAKVYKKLDKIEKHQKEISLQPLGRVSEYLVSHLTESFHNPVIHSPANAGQTHIMSLFEFKTEYSPVFFADLIGSINSSVITQVKLEIKNLKWTIKGVLYDKA